MQIHLMKTVSMISSILFYLMSGVIINFLYDQFIDWSEAEYRFNLRERLIVGLLWPLALILFIYHALKTYFGNE